MSKPMSLFIHENSISLVMYRGDKYGLNELNAIDWHRFIDYSRKYEVN